MGVVALGYWRRDRAGVPSFHGLPRASPPLLELGLDREGLLTLRLRPGSSRDDDDGASWDLWIGCDGVGA